MKVVVVGVRGVQLKKTVENSAHESSKRDVTA